MSFGIDTTSFCKFDSGGWNMDVISYHVKWVGVIATTFYVLNLKCHIPEKCDMKTTSSSSFFVEFIVSVCASLLLPVRLCRIGESNPAHSPKPWAKRTAVDTTIVLIVIQPSRPNWSSG